MRFMPGPWGPVVGDLFCTTNGGLSWSLQGLEIGARVIACADETHLWIAGGATWQQLKVLDCALEAIAAAPSRAI
jgi:hypothetical protein